jgi:hypothetical protein
MWGGQAVSFVVSSLLFQCQKDLFSSELARPYGPLEEPMAEAAVLCRRCQF